MAKEKDDFSDLKETSRPRDAAWKNWAKWNKVGDEVTGYIRDVFFRPEEVHDGMTMKAQRALTIEQKDGTLINVGIKYIPFILSGTDDLRLGDVVKIVFSQEIPHEKKMFNAIKQFRFYGNKLPQNDGNKTVKQLTLEDMAVGGTTAPVISQEDLAEEAAARQAATHYDGKKADELADQIAF